MTWKNEGYRHGLSKKGIKTKLVSHGTKKQFIPPLYIKNGVYGGKKALFITKDGNYYQYDEDRINPYNGNFAPTDGVVIYAETKEELNKKIAYLEQGGIIPQSWKTNYKGYDIYIYQEKTPDRSNKTWTIFIEKDGKNILRGSADYRGKGQLNNFNEYIKTDKFKKSNLKWNGGTYNNYNSALQGDNFAFHQSHFLTTESASKLFIDQLESGQLKKKIQVDW